MCGFDSCYPWFLKKNTNIFFTRIDKRKKHFIYFFPNQKKYNFIRKTQTNKITPYSIFFNFNSLKLKKKLVIFNSLNQSNNSYGIIRFFFFKVSPFLSFFKIPLFNFFFNNFKQFYMDFLNRYLNLNLLFKPISKIFFFTTNHLIFFKKYNNNFFLNRNSSLNTSYRYFNKYRINNLFLDNFEKNTIILRKFEIANISLNNILDKYTTFRKHQCLYNYFIFNKIFFKSLLFFKKNFKKIPSFFQISNFDKINNFFYRLTRATKFINLYDFYSKSSKTLPLFNQINFYKSQLSYLITNNPNYSFLKTKPRSLMAISENFTKKFNETNLKIVKNTTKYSLFNKQKTYSQFNTLFYFWNKIELICFFFLKPVFLKYLNCVSFNTLNYNSVLNLNSFKEPFTNYFNSFFFYNNSDFSNLTNLIPNSNLHYIVKKTVIRIFSFDKFPSLVTPWYYQTLIRFLEFCSGRKVCLRFNAFLNNSLSEEEKIRCFLWSQRVKYFRKILGPKLFLNESIQIMYLALKNKDPYLLSNWMVTTMYKISFWKYKTFLRYIKYVLRYFFWSIFTELRVKGIKFQLKGKISVAGNARTRTAFHYVGFTSHATFNNKILYNLSLVKSFTGVMGLKLWIVF